MFGGLRQGNLFYILDKSNLTLHIGEVENVSNPKTKYNQNAFQSVPFAQPEAEIDIRVKVGDSVHNIEQLPVGQSSTLKNNVFVTDSKDMMNAEVEAMLRSSRQAIDSVPYHENVITACDKMLRELNPQFAKEKQQEEKIGALEEKIGGMELTLNQMMGILSEAIGHGKPTKTKED